jgi:hypothetical protein
VRAGQPVVDAVREGFDLDPNVDFDLAARLLARANWPGSQNAASRWISQNAETLPMAYGATLLNPTGH